MGLFQNPVRFSLLHIFMSYIWWVGMSWCWMPCFSEYCVVFLQSCVFSISFLSWERVKLGGWWLPVFPNDNNAEDNGRTMRHVKLHQLFRTFPGEFDIMRLFDYKDCCCFYVSSWEPSEATQKSHSLKLGFFSGPLLFSGHFSPRFSHVHPQFWEPRPLSPKWRHKSPKHRVEPQSCAGQGLPHKSGTGKSSELEAFFALCLRNVVHYCIILQAISARSIPC